LGAGLAHAAEAPQVNTVSRAISPNALGARKRCPSLSMLILGRAI
jgi:hypothetical protein